MPNKKYDGVFEGGGIKEVALINYLEKAIEEFS